MSKKTTTPAAMEPPLPQTGGSYVLDAGGLRRSEDAPGQPEQVTETTEEHTDGE
jgi:hypothetical protein